MFNKQPNKPQNRIDTLIGAGTKIDGNVHFSGGLRVDGEINGNIFAEPGKPSTLVLSEHARVKGEIKVTHLVVNGTVNGPVRASEYLELLGKANITGDVQYGTMEIHLGATISGKLVHLAAENADEKVVALKMGSNE
ncbi:MAG TPA: polymer-forming cytoskeletal protein [Gallionellaceae bacterium]